MNRYIENFDAAVAAYLANASGVGLAETTRINYASTLKKFRNWWTESNNGEPGHDLITEDFIAFRDAEIEKGAKPATVRQNLITLSLFFSAVSDPLLFTVPYYSCDPISKRIYPKRPKPKPYDVGLDTDDIIALIKTRKYRWERYHARNYAMVIVLLTTKIRNQELAELRLCDVDFEHGELSIEHGKGDKFRVVDMPEIASTAIQLYLASGERPEYLSENDYLFGGGNTGADGRREWNKLDRSTVSDVVRYRVSRVTGKEGIRSHALRHAGSIIDLNAGVYSISELQSELGHSSVTTTELYAGRLMARRKRVETKRILDAEEETAEENKKLLAEIEAKQAAKTVS